MDKFIPILEQYGASSTILFVIVYLLWNGEISFHYPRKKKRK